MHEHTLTHAYTRAQLIPQLTTPTTYGTSNCGSSDTRFKRSFVLKVFYFLFFYFLTPRRCIVF